MVAKKDLVIVVLATFCLTATMFMIIPTSSQNSKYDPWLDINEDGTINIIDLAKAAKAFGSSGDSTKNVNVTNWAYPASKTILYETYDIVWNRTYPWGLFVRGQAQKKLYVGNYTTMSILARVDNSNYSGSTFLGIRAYWSDETGASFTVPLDLPMTLAQIGSYRSNSQIWATTYSILSPYIRMEPLVFNWREVDTGLSEGNATLSVFVNLSSGGTGESSTTSNHEMLYEVETNKTPITLGDYCVIGYRKFTIMINSNVTMTDVLLIGSGSFNVLNFPIDQANGVDAFRGTYEVTSPYIYVNVYPSAQPVKLIISVYLVP